MVSTEVQPEIEDKADLTSLIGDTLPWAVTLIKMAELSGFRDNVSTQVNKINNIVLEVFGYFIKKIKQSYILCHRVYIRYICFVFPPTFGLFVSSKICAYILSSKILLNANSFHIICPRGGDISPSI